MKKDHGNTGNGNARKYDSAAMTSVVHMRALPADKTAWVREAQKTNMKLSAWITETLNAAIDK